MLRGSIFTPSNKATSHLFSYLSKIPFSLACRKTAISNFYHSTRVVAKPSGYIQAYHVPMDRVSKFSSLSTCAVSPIHESSTPSSNEQSRKSKKKARRESPEAMLTHKLGICSKKGDLVEALHLYDEARKSGLQLNQHQYTVLLYVCASSSSSDSGVTGDSSDASRLGLTRGFEIFKQMIADKVSPNEATFTNVARLAAAMDDPDMAFDLVKQMKTFGIPPRLRSYGPALFGFCKKGDTGKACEVDAHMSESGVMAEEPELSALLRLSADKKVDKVYEMMHRLRASVRQVSESTLGIIEDWFNSESAAKLGKDNWDVNKVKDGIVQGGGGWHGQGWLGSGRWRVARTHMEKNGVCFSCGEKLVCVDIDPAETENFATSLANLAYKKEKKADFLRFEEWLQKHGPFDAVVDGANVGLINQHKFSFNQLNTIVNRLRQVSRSKKLPLVILHRSRVNGGPAQSPYNQKLLEMWKNSGALYPTPIGSNDDWYWLYAAVSSKSLLVTNDEMRDHLFQLLGTSFFPRWKEKHQVRLSVSRQGINLLMPPPYSLVIQESEIGSWHVPAITDDDIETPRQWLCATRETKTHMHNVTSTVKAPSEDASRPRKPSARELVNIFNS